MTMRTLPVLTAALCAAFLSRSAAAEFKVTPDKENVVALRLAGDWQVDPDTTKRLIGDVGRAKEWFGVVSFKSDPAVLTKLPAKYEKFLGDKPIYMAGTMTLRGTRPGEHVFVLIQLSGNPHIVWFRERGGDPLGDAESFNVMIAGAEDTKNDLLFLGGDHGKEPFAGFARTKVEAK